MVFVGLVMTFYFFGKLVNVLKKNKQKIWMEKQNRKEKQLCKQ